MANNVMPPAVDQKRPVGRPKTITDMKAYKREKARQYRARDEKRRAKERENG